MRRNAEMLRSGHPLWHHGPMADFVHLHLHSEHSPLDGLTRVSDAVKTAKAQGSPAVALTDHGQINGWYVLHKEAEKAGIKPIYGIEAYLAQGSRFEPDDVYVDRDDEDVSEVDPTQLKGAEAEANTSAKSKKRKSYYHLTLLARTPEGFSNLILLNNESQKTFRYHPLSDFDLLNQLGEGLIVLTGCLGGPLAGPLSRGDALGVMEAEGDLRDALASGDVNVVRDAAQRLVAFAAMPASTIVVGKKVREALEAARKRDTASVRADKSVTEAKSKLAKASNAAEAKRAQEALERAQEKAKEHEGDSVADIWARVDAEAEDARALRETRANVLMAAIVSRARGNREPEAANVNELAALAGHDNVTPARDNLATLVRAVGRENVYVEVMDHGIDAESRALRALVRLAHDEDLTLVATNDCHYTHAHDKTAHDAWLCLSTGSVMTDQDRFRFQGSGYHMRSPEEMVALHPQSWWARACENTVKVAERVEGDLMPAPHQRLPQFPLIPEGFDSSSDYLHHLVRQGALWRYGEDPERPGKLPPMVAKRLRWEEEVISGAGVCDYFLILHDLDEWARSSRGIPQMTRAQFDEAVANGETFTDEQRDELLRGVPGQKKPIRVGPGRGSAAGSAFAYCLSMTQLDPIANGLLFERFLNPERVGLPDVDTDFEKERRSEVLQYLVAVYGRDMVARVGTFGLDRLKAAIKDASRVLDLSSFGTRLATMVPVHQGKAASLKSITVEPGPDSKPSERDTFNLGKPFRDAVAQSAPFARQIVARAKKFQRFDKTLDNATALHRAGDWYDLDEVMAALLDAAADSDDSLAALDARDMDFQRAADSGPSEGEMILSVVSRMEDVVRNEGTHACATLVSDAPMANLVPLRYDRSKGADAVNAPMIVGWEGGDVDAYGLLKLDVLGLITLDVISRTLDYIHDTTGEDLDTDAIVPGDRSTEVAASRDDATFQLIGEGRTSAVFQLASSGMRDLAQAVRPTSLDDLTALVALYRPGPMGAGMHTMYADRKNGRERVSYAYLTRDKAEQEVLEGVLGETYGVVVYQEQLMRVGTAVGGLNAAWTNKLRKAFSKKKKDLMDAVRAEFYKGALAGDNPSHLAFQEKTLDAIWATFEASAEYLFNKSHAACYGLLAYWTAYLKANWPVEFSAAVLSLTTDSGKRRDILRTLEDEGVTVLPPDVNHSHYATAPDNGAVRFGLSEVKGIGKAAELVISERREHGEFASLGDMLRRVNRDAGRKGRDASLTTANVEDLIAAGALDRFGNRAGQYMVSRIAGEVDASLVPSSEWGPFEKDRRQRDRLGLTLGDHPLNVRRAEIARIAGTRFARPNSGWTNARKFAEAADGTRIASIGLLTRFDRKMGRKSAYALIEFEFADRSVVSGIMFSRSLDKMDERGDEPTLGMPCIVYGTVRVKVYEREQTTEGGETFIETSQVKELFVDRVSTIPDLDDILDEDPALSRRIRTDLSFVNVSWGETTFDLDPSSPAFHDTDARVDDGEGTWVYGGELIHLTGDKKDADPHLPAFVGPGALDALFDWACGAEVPLDHEWHPMV